MRKYNLKSFYGFLLAIICGVLGAWGGTDGTSKMWRRILIPVLITCFAYFHTESILVITIMAMIGALSIGYGIPDPTDTGSTLGKFFYNLFNGNHFLADIFTRGTIGLIIGISLISIPIIKKNWSIYGWCCLGIILTNALISWRNLGGYYLFGKFLIWSETLTWVLITLFATLIIILK